MSESTEVSSQDIVTSPTGADCAAATAARWWCRPSALLAVIGFGLAIRLAIFAVAYHNSGLLTVHTDNTPLYLLSAESLLSTGRFAIDGAPEVLRTPGYPLFLIPGLWAGHVELVTIGMQLLLSAATIWLIYNITLSWTDRRAAALAAAFLAAIEPMSIVFTCLLMTETLFTFLLVLSMQRLLSYLTTDSLAALAQTALLLAMATFVRPVSYYLPTILAALLLARAVVRSESRVRAVGYAATFWAVSMTPLIAWQVRNYTQTGYSSFAAIADLNLYFYHGVSVLAHERGQPILTVQNELGFSSLDRFDQMHPQLRPGDQAAKFHYMHAEGKRLVCEHPWIFAENYLRGLAVLILNPGACDVLTLLHRYPTDRPLRPIGLDLLGVVRNMQATAPQLFYSNLFLLTSLATTYLVAALGLASQLHRLSWQFVALATVACYFLAVSGGAPAASRLRHPVMPLIIILSGIGIAQFAAWWHRPRVSPTAC